MAETTPSIPPDRAPDPLPPQMQTAESDTPWLPVIVGVVLIALLIAGVTMYARKQQAIEQATQQASGPQTVDVYAEDLVLTEFRLSQAENLVGGRVTYLDGKVKNIGGRVVTGMQVESVFRNTLGEIVQKEAAQPMQSHRAGLPYVDTTDFKAAPLRPNEVRDFRLSYDRISADWNQGIPELRIVKVSFGD